jgi:RimJ/RimL family protein N-acetyltransferase
MVPLWEHGERHFLESGRDGQIIFSPGRSPKHSFDRFSDDSEEKWEKSPTELGWGRTWILENEERVLGSVELQNHLFLKSALHRSILTIGLEAEARGKGFGRLLLQTAIDWALTIPSLAWVQLYVFEHNLPAVKLYESVGFRSVGVMSDLFRLDGRSIDDMEMVLRLRA